LGYIFVADVIGLSTNT